MTDQQTIEQAIVDKRIIAVGWLPDISCMPPFEALKGTFELESITLEGGIKLILSSASGYEEVLAEIEKTENMMMAE